MQNSVLLRNTDNILKGNFEPQECATVSRVLLRYGTQSSSQSAAGLRSPGESVQRPVYCQGDSAKLRTAVAPADDVKDILVDAKGGEARRGL